LIVTSVDIGVTTVCRPLLLQSALNSLIRTSRQADWTVRILVVDNDVDGSAFETVNKLAATSPVPIIYLHEPRRGISYARNAILKAVTADYLAFFDDDQIADPSWLASLVATAQTYSADVVFGPVLSILPDGAPSWIRRGGFFDRVRWKTGTRRPTGGTGSVLIRKATLDSAGRGFDTAFALSGGEDTEFFAYLGSRGAVMVWCDEAIATEAVPPERLSLRWLLRRNYRVGMNYADTFYKQLTPAGALRWWARRTSALLGAPVGMVLGLPLGRHYSAQAAMVLSRNFGQVNALFGSQYDEYSGHHQREVAAMERDVRPFHVVISQHRLLHYRVDFFNALKDACSERGIRLDLVHGQASATERLKKDEGSLPWATRVKNRIARVRGVDVLWQPLPSELRDPDLLILMQENRIVSNYAHILRRRLGRRLVAFWGHGANFQSSTPDNLRERWKRYLTAQVDYWFAYTSVSTKVIENTGFPSERIACLNNSIDTREFRTQCETADPDDIAAMRAAVGIPSDAVIGLFCGSLYPEKRFDLLIGASDIIYDQVKNFHLVVIGSGPSLPDLQRSASSRPWIHLVGIQTGRTKAAWFKTSRILLNPGLVGLHVLDSFASGLPMVSTECTQHGPEIAYLESGINGLLTENDTVAYASAAIKILTDDQFSAELSKRAIEASHLYSLDFMVQNFLSGLEACRRLGGTRS
jgi:L-malate glycosyltransferase